MKTINSYFREIIEIIFSLSLQEYFGCYYNCYEYRSPMFAGLSMTPRLFSELPIQGFCTTSELRICDWPPPVTSNQVDIGRQLYSTDYGPTSKLQISNKLFHFMSRHLESRFWTGDRWCVIHLLVISLVKASSGRYCLFRPVCLQTFWVRNLHNTQNVFIFY